MNIIQKAASFVLVAAIGLTSVITVGAAENTNKNNGSYAVFAKQGMTFTGNSSVQYGDVYVQSGEVKMDSFASLTKDAILRKPSTTEVTGSGYLWGDFKDRVVNHDSNQLDVAEYDYPELPTKLDPKENLKIGWEYQQQYYEVDQSGSYDTINITADSKLAFVVEQGETLTITVDKLSVNGDIAVQGGGKVHLFVNEFITGNTYINRDGNADQLSIVILGTGVPNEQVSLTNLYICNANIFSQNVALSLNGKGQYAGNFYVSKDFLMGSSIDITGMIYAPTEDLTFSGMSTVTGFVVGKTVSLHGSARIIYGKVDINDNEFVAQEDPEETPSVPELPQVDVYGEGKVIEQGIVSSTAQIPVITTRFSTGPVNYMVYVAGALVENCEGAEIYVNDEQAYVSSKTGEWSKQISLQELQQSKNDITIRVTNANGDEIVTKYVYGASFPSIPQDLDDVPATQIIDFTVANQPVNGLIKVKGQYTDEYDVKPTIYINGLKATTARVNNEEHLDFRDAENEFWAFIPVPAGHTTVIVTAENRYGSKSEASKEVFFYEDIDPETAPAPILTGRAGRETDGFAYISGTISDLNDTTAEVYVDGKQAHIASDGTWSIKVTVTSGLNTFAVTAVNIYGKTTTVIATRTY